jgi:hypothetical protein
MDEAVFDPENEFRNPNRTDRIVVDKENGLHYLLVAFPTRRDAILSEGQPLAWWRAARMSD